MLTFSQETDKPDIEKFEKYIRHNGYILYDKQKMEDRYDYQCVERDSLAVYTTDIMKHRSSFKYGSLDRETLYRYLTRVEHCPEHYFEKRGVNGYSLDKTGVLTPLYNNGYAQEFLESYLQYNDKKATCTSIKSLLKIKSDPIAKGHSGEGLHKFDYSVNQQTNLRYNYKNVDIISQIPVEYTDCITVEDGYCLVWGDFAQSDLRIAYNLFLRSDDNIDIMRETADKYEGIARIIAKTFNEPFDLEKFKNERSLYKLHVLQTLYGTRNSRDNTAKDFITKLSRYLETCDKYQEYLRRINRHIDLNLPLVTKSYFGYEQDVPSWRSTRDGITYFALNSPNQSCTSELVIMTCCAILDKFYAAGYSEDDINLYMVRHDEPIFKVKVDALKDAWFFNDCSTIQVDDWIPLQLDFTVGYNYKVPDEDLMAIMQKSFDEHKQDLTPARPCTVDSSKFFPMQDVTELYFHYSKVYDKTVVAILSKDLKAVDLHLVNSVDEKEVETTIIKMILDLSPMFVARESNGLIVKNNFIDGGRYHEGNLIKFFKEVSVSMYEAQVICEYMANQVAVTQMHKEPLYQKSDLGDLLTWSSLTGLLKKGENKC